MRIAQGTYIGTTQHSVMRVISTDNLAMDWRPDIRYLVRVESEADQHLISKLHTAGIENLTPLISNRDQITGNPIEPFLVDDGSLEFDDVVVVRPKSRYVDVLFRESDKHHTVFLTNRCNSKCLMCSQPPTSIDDSWLIDEAIELATHIRISPPIIGFTGGEPLLLDANLAVILNTFNDLHPATRFEVLTNARLFANAQLSNHLLNEIHGNVTWMIPLYGPTDRLHDYVVQAAGAFDETISGLLNLQECAQSVQLRTVLITPVLENLDLLCNFIARNLPFVKEVALMGCEPIGFARANPDECLVQLGGWSESLERAANLLERSGISVIFMNLPLCSIPSTLHRLAHKSISDWKQEYAPECDGCIVRESCCGFFSWDREARKPNPIMVLKDEEV